MAGNVVRMRHQVGRFYGLLTKTQVGNGCTTRFFTVIRKIPLGIKGGLSPMILIADLLAPTVPSEPKPKNLQLMVPLGAVSTRSISGREVSVTSSVIPIVNPSLG